MKEQKVLNTIQALLAGIGWDTSSRSLADKVAKEYVATMLWYIERNGKKWTLDRYKSYALLAKKHALCAVFDPIPFVKSDKIGFPKALRTLRPYLEGTADQKRFALTVIRSYELITLPVDTNFSALTNPIIKPISPEFLKGFAAFTEIWKTRVTGTDSPLRLSEPEGFHSSVGVMGPNGPALLTSHYDASAMVNQRYDLVQSIRVFSRKLALSVIGIGNLTEPNDKHILSRLALIPEPGGKTRLIAIGDYWTQNALKPLHNSLMGILRKLETDGTWDQEGQAQRVSRLATHDSKSFDLSSATDRFPASIQKVVIELFYSKEIAEAWYNLMINRDFHYKDTIVRWAVGQPLGFYSSWATFALTHHILIEYCAYLEGIRSFREYAVLGDDVVIWNKSVARRYEIVMAELGVQINLTKTITSNEHHVQVEFAKRLFWNGVEISGLSWKLLYIASRHLAMLVDLWVLAQKRSWDLERSYFSAPEHLGNKGSVLFSLLLWERTEGKAPFPDGLIPVELSNLRNEILKFRILDLEERRLGVDKILMKNDLIKVYFEAAGVAVNQQLLDYGSVMHPIVYHVNEVGMSIYDKLEEIAEAANEINAGNIPMLPCEYFPNLGTSTYFGDRRLLISKKHANIVWKAYYSLTSLQSKSIE